MLGGSQAVLLTDERFLGIKDPVEVDRSLLVLPEDQRGEAVGGLDAFRQGLGLCLGLQEGHDRALNLFAGAQHFHLVVENLLLEPGILGTNNVFQTPIVQDFPAVVGNDEAREARRVEEFRELT